MRVGGQVVCKLFDSVTHRLTLAICRGDFTFIHNKISYTTFIVFCADIVCKALVIEASIIFISDALGICI